MRGSYSTHLYITDSNEGLNSCSLHSSSMIFPIRYPNFCYCLSIFLGSRLGIARMPDLDAMGLPWTTHFLVIQTGIRVRI